MNIGINITPIQGPHRMRGVGAVVLNFINNLSGEDRRRHKFIFYVWRDEDVSDTKESYLDLLDLSDLSYEVRYLNPKATVKARLPGKLQLLVSVYKFLHALVEMQRGQDIGDFDGIDVYLQTDQMQSIPRMKARKVLIAYDLIPFVLGADYLPSYQNARHKGFSRRAASKAQYHRQMYKLRVQANARRANKVIAISEYTKKDFQKYLGTPGEKISVVPLGVSKPHADPKPPVKHFVKTSWGYSPRPYDATDPTPYVLFVGGADPRRKLDNLVDAFNNLRARGVELKLMLSGDILQGANNIPVASTRSALNNSSYAEDIIYLGFTDEATKNWLYGHAAAFIFPSKYEGFGLPVLEAMVYGSPVICYENSAVKEIGGTVPLYAHDSKTLRECIAKVLSYSDKETAAIRQRGQQQARKYSWSKTSQSIIEVLR
jgi:glycosyltransferase involved in cell wall biosynthesis